MSERKAYHAVAEREDGWWVITVPELDVVTQAHRLDQVEHMARDLIAVWLEVDYETVSVDVEVRIPEAWREEVEQARRLREEAERAQEAAADRAREVARDLHARGLPLRDVGAVLGVSYQRAQQLTRGRKHERKTA